ncbi:MAG TPA: hypothetical protein PLW43_02160 [Chitinophagales bacterium]|nr:hypothetical protein [Chitinophagales bacterium]
MKKTIYTAILFLIFGMVATSCKKEECPAPTYPIEGYWVGKYGNDTITPNSGYSMVVEPGGNLTVADGSSISTASKASGTWTLTGSTFSTTYTYSNGGPTYSFTATWTNDGKLRDGTWGNNNNTSGRGTWYMDRVN